MGVSRGCVAAEVGVLAAGRTWRAPLSYRISLIMVQAGLVALPTGYIWFALWTNEVAKAGWLVVPCAAGAWGWLAFRAWTISATLTPDSLLIRGVFSTVQIGLADITKVGFRRGVLTVTESRSSPATHVMTAAPRHRDAGERHTVSAICIGAMASASGLRCDADDAADLIAAAAGLPALPPREAKIDRKQARATAIIGLALLFAGAGVSLLGHRSSFAGHMVALLGVSLLVPAFLATLDRFRSR
jgi:hypothetical protein